MIHTIRIPREHWERVWFALVKSGPISRIPGDRVYLIDSRQLRMLRKRKLPFELLSPPNGHTADATRGLLDEFAQEDILVTESALRIH